MDDIHDPEIMQKIKYDLEDKPAGELSLDERMSLEHIRLHQEHAGHDVMHFGMAMVLLVTMVVVQIILFLWKRWHFKSYQPVSLFGLWVIPLIVCLRNQWWRFVSVWVFFSIMTGLIFYKSLQRPIQRNVPRLVYRWFYYIHKISYASGFIGYGIVLVAFFGFDICLHMLADTCMEYGPVLVFYGLYFGVLARDIAEICSERMAVQMGYCNVRGLPTRTLRKDVCAVCGHDMSQVMGSCMNTERTYKLNCSHKFHEFCIRGWYIIGKKQTCPLCREKVDLNLIFRNPWEKTHVLYTRMLDLLRYMVSWQPLILTIVQGINYMFGLK